jgi:hypothetical protein
MAVLAAAALAMTPVFLKVTPSAVYRGHVVTIRGNAGSCSVGDTVSVLSRAFVHTHDFAGVPAVLAKVKSGGGFGATTRIPARRRPGRYVVTARCGGGNLGVTAHLRVRA